MFNKRKHRFTLPSLQKGYRILHGYTVIIEQIFIILIGGSSVTAHQEISSGNFFESAKENSNVHKYVNNRDDHKYVNNRDDEGCGGS